MAQERGRPSAATRGGRETTQKAETNQEASARSMPERTQVDKTRHTDAPQNVIIPFAVYTLAEAARLLHVSERKVRELAAAGELPRLRYTRSFLVFGEDIIAFLRAAGDPAGGVS